MNILHLIPYLGKAQGGPVESLRLLASAQSEIGHSIRVVYTGISADGEPVNFSDTVQIFHVESYGPTRWSPKLINSALSNGFVPDVVHSHGLWLDAGRQAAKISRRLNVPHIISPCGMLQEDALRRSIWKKTLAWFAFQKRVLLSATVLHAKSDAEASGLEKIFTKLRIKVVPNSIEMPPGSHREKEVEEDGKLRRCIFEEIGLTSDHRVVLFLGRIHPVKGLERLIDAWSGIFEQFPDWRLFIVGPNENGYQANLESKMTSDIGETIKFPGPIWGDKRWEAYQAANLLVAPSDFENFGQSIAEALSTGLPVITTTGTPWKELQEKKCGWWVEPSPASIARALEEAMRLTDVERKAKGAIGRKIVQRFFPESIAQEMCALYDSLIK
ncbi:glycosyltransferase [Thermodesulfobacteriota bacterium]